MTELFRTISFNDDVTPVFDALSEWCKYAQINPNSMEGSSAASRLFDFFQAGFDTKDGLLSAMRDGINTRQARAAHHLGATPETMQANFSNRSS